jgi:hypothetical protein
LPPPFPSPPAPFGDFGFSARWALPLKRLGGPGRVTGVAAPSAGGGSPAGSGFAGAWASVRAIDGDGLGVAAITGVRSVGTVAGAADGAAVSDRDPDEVTTGPPSLV